ncbi:MAG: hypothetical protein ACOC3Z_02090 [Nanoarchaeota archaeon]
MKKKVMLVASTMLEDGSYWNELLVDMFGNDKDYHIIKEKIENLSKLYKEKSKSNELDELLDMDFGTEIWDMI